ncbi:O-methyltransferase [Enterobacter asburiae]|uniref:O-methyltransferase n=1 Tax=Enterobacter asburiae TaxID=61645 RepID=UPI00301A2D52
MAGEYIPYHLRHNKSIDREIFLEGLNTLAKKINLSSYTYIGFGGPMLEDFRIMHSRTPISQLISLEEKEPTFKRQQYNLPYNCIDCRLKSAHDFIVEYNFSTPTITWLDYASPNQIQNDLNDIQALSTKVSSFDILKVTFPVNPASYYQRRVGENLDQYNSKFTHAVRSMLGRKFLDYDLTIENADLSDRKITNLLTEIITNAFKIATERGLSNRRDNMKFFPLTLNKYNDGIHTMLTISGYFAKDEEHQMIIDHCHLQNWSYYSPDWTDIHEIAIPTLTIKEKINLDSKLPDMAEYQAAADEFSMSSGDRDNYFKYYRLYPNFQRVIV